MSNALKGFKVFHPDWTCHGFQYKVGETYHHDGEIGLCKAGFHFCQVASDCFRYYCFNPDNKVAEVEAIGLTKTERNKSVTDCIRIVREIPWYELLTIVNTGRSCIGMFNSGNSNVGDYNSGDYNTGNRNIGNFNSGCDNKGSWNNGNFNIGNCNSGFFNIGNCNSGFFNTDEPFARSFNKPTSIKISDFYNIPGVQILMCNYKNNQWIHSNIMSEEEKAAHPEHVTTGGYLKTVSFQKACRMMWEKFSNKEKNEVRKIPNFDAAIFEEITGIKA